MIDSGARTVTVKYLVSYLKQYIEHNKHLKAVAVRGEISNFKVHPSGMVFFDLKEADAVLNVVVRSKEAAKLPVLRNGQAVVASGYVTAYLAGSRYQLVAAVVKIDGVGDLHAAYEELKRKLNSEGLFAPERKRALPRYPFRVGLVSSPQAAGAGDFVQIVRRRAPHIEIVWFTTPVQGDGAVPEIVGAIDSASRADIDVMAIVRGGGSFEDLFPFSSEGVVRAIVRSKHPVVTAVGHHIDQPLCDLAADLRAPTPSDAANLIAPDRAELLESLMRSRRRLGTRAQETLERHAEVLARFARATVFADGSRLLAPLEQRLAHARDRLLTAVHDRVRAGEAQLAPRRDGLRRHDPAPVIARRRDLLATRRERLGGALRAYMVMQANRLDRSRTLLGAKDPSQILRQGYAIVTEGERVITDAGEVAPGTAVRARLARGTILARVEATENDGGREEKR